MKSNKVSKKLLSEVNDFDLTNFLNMVLAKKLENNQRNPPEPVGKKNYIGIEIECFTTLENMEVMELLLQYDLEDYVNIGDDGSIEPDHFEDTYELRVLTPEKELSEVLKRLGAFLKEGGFKTNKSCGLHVHLDMRNRKVDNCYKKLLKFQHLMFPLVAKHRWGNDYCPWALEEEQNRDAVNYLSYEDLQTIEIRLHHGTTDVKKIKNWINLLLRAIKTSPIKSIDTKAEAISWAGKNKSLKSYIKKEFKTSFFKVKDKIMEGYHEENEEEGVW